jgi:PKD repeat protein
VSSGIRVVWDFGDGSTSTEVSPEYAYQSPGKYTVTLYVYNSFGQATYSTSPVTVVIRDFIEDTFTVTTSAASLDAANGTLTAPILITQTIPARLVGFKTVLIEKKSINNTVGFLPRSYSSDDNFDTISTFVLSSYVPTTNDVRLASTIQYEVSGSNTQTYFRLSRNKYNHLEAYNSLIKKTFIPTLSGFELTPIEDIQIPLTPVYAKISSGNIVATPLSGTGTTLAGFSGLDTFYYRDDFPCNKYTLTFRRKPVQFSNTLGVSLSGTITQNLDIAGLSITSNGIDGDGGVSTSFNIDKNKFEGVKIHFVVKIKDSQLNTIKNFPPLTLQAEATNQIEVVLVGDINPNSYTVYSLQNTLSTLSGGGYFRGYVEYTDPITSVLSGISLSARVTSIINIQGTPSPSAITTELFELLLSEDSLVLTTEGALGEYDIESTSNTFNIYPKSYYVPYKKGEEFDGQSMFKSLVFQETLVDKNVLFDDFFGTIFGDLSASPQSLGKIIYERIRNFVDNNGSIETAEISKLISLGNMVDHKSTIFDRNLNTFPTLIQRIVGLLSINKHKLFGESNKFARNFNTFGRTTKDEYGKNLGDEVDPLTYTVNLSTNLVAYEKFSKKYKLLNTYQPLCASPYKLSAYSNDWGWPLTLPTNFTANDLSIYYTFYEHNPTPEGNIVGSVLNFDLTNIPQSTPLSALVESGGIYENIILDTLYQSLSLN